MLVESLAGGHEPTGNSELTLHPRSDPRSITQGSGRRCITSREQLSHVPERVQCHPKDLPVEPLAPLFGRWFGEPRRQRRCCLRMMARWRQLASEALGPRDHVQRKQQSRSEQRITANESRQQTPCIQGSLFFFYQRCMLHSAPWFRGVRSGLHSQTGCGLHISTSEVPMR